MSAPVLSIDLGLPVPVYRQIADGLRALLLEDAAPVPGERLPTVRRLAVDLGVHHNTVAQAYRVLEQEGWLELVRGRGAVVRERRTPEPADAARVAFRRRLEALVNEGLGQGLPRRWLADELRLRSESVGREGGRS